MGITDDNVVTHQVTKHINIIIIDINDINIIIISSVTE